MEAPPNTSLVVLRSVPHTQWRARRGRPKTPAPKTGWLLAELAGLTNISLRTLRSYVTYGIIRPVEFRGTATRYGRREFLRLLRLLRLHTTGHKLRLSALKRQLDAFSDQELEAWVATQRLGPRAAAALGIVWQDPDRQLPTAAAADTPIQSAAVERWQRIRLLPGLELSVSVDASPAIQRIAQRIYDEFIGTAPRLDA